MTRSELLDFLREHRLAVQASSTLSGPPQAAVIGIVTSDALEIFFDTLGSSRKAANLRADPRIALVVGWDLERGRTAQLEGVVDEPQLDELARLQRLYFERFPDGRDRLEWPDICYFRVRLTWARYSDFAAAPPIIYEFDQASLEGGEAS
jgi:general stress protein 26